jgi:hypothetical protein
MEINADDKKEMLLSSTLEEMLQEMTRYSNKLKLLQDIQESA